jgi:hypothetical protein
VGGFPESATTYTADLMAFSDGQTMDGPCGLRT